MNISSRDAIRAIAGRTSLTRDTKADTLLELGLALFDMQIGIISYIRDGQYTVMYCQPSDAQLHPGTVFDLGITYCSLTIRLPMPLPIPYATNSEYRRHPCREAFGLESYIGARFTHPDGALGTVNFSSTEPHKPFSQEERRFIQEMATTVEQALCSAAV